MKKVILGIAAAIAAISASAFTINNEEGEQVGKLASNQWVIALEEEQGLTWDCFDGGNVCKGTLKAGATPDMSGFYSDSEVNPVIENYHFELISEPDGIRNNSVNYK